MSMNVRRITTIVMLTLIVTMRSGITPVDVKLVSVGMGTNAVVRITNCKATSPRLVCFVFSQSTLFLICYSSSSYTCI